MHHAPGHSLEQQQSERKQHVISTGLAQNTTDYRQMWSSAKGREGQVCHTAPTVEIVAKSGSELVLPWPFEYLVDLCTCCKCLHIQKIFLLDPGGFYAAILLIFPCSPCDT